jgi:CheY-like chemotaxis protein
MTPNILPYILIVEDDHLQEGPLEDELTQRFPGARIETLTTESEFRARVPQLCADPPDVVIMDVMLRWATPSRDPVPVPEEVAAKGYYRAGLRCAALMRDSPELRAVPVVFLTILERNDLDRTETGEGERSGTSYVRKSADFHPLVRRLRSLVNGS